MSARLGEPLKANPRGPHTCPAPSLPSTKLLSVVDSVLFLMFSSEWAKEIKEAWNGWIRTESGHPDTKMTPGEWGIRGYACRSNLHMFTRSKSVPSSCFPCLLFGRGCATLFSQGYRHAFVILAGLLTDYVDIYGVIWVKYWQKVINFNNVEAK